MLTVSIYVTKKHENINIYIYIYIYLFVCCVFVFQGKHINGPARHPVFGTGLLKIGIATAKGSHKRQLSAHSHGWMGAGSGSPGPRVPRPGSRSAGPVIWWGSGFSRFYFIYIYIYILPICPNRDCLLAAPKCHGAHGIFPSSDPQNGNCRWMCARVRVPRSPGSRVPRYPGTQVRVY